VRLGYRAELKHRYKLMRWPYLAIGEMQKNGESAAHNLEQVLRKITGNYSGLLIAPKPCAGVAHEAELE